MIRTVLGCPSTEPHTAHGWTSPRAGRVSCDGVEGTPAARLVQAWFRAGGGSLTRPPVSLQLAVVQYCADVPGTPIPTLDDITAVRALVTSARRADRANV